MVREALSDDAAIKASNEPRPEGMSGPKILALLLTAFIALIVLTRVLRALHFTLPSG